VKRAEERDPGREFLLFANAACLDLVNTEIISSGQRVDLLADFSDLVAWLEAAGLVDGREASDARARWDGTGEGRRALEEARRLRGLLRATAERAVAGRPIGRDAVAAINDVLRRPVHTSELRRTASGFERAERWEFSSPEDLLVPVAESARDLLAGGDLSLVRKCRNPDCILFFYDTTKNRARAWCSMSSCGNRTKVAAHYQRQRAARRRAR
jgi:predicted RNA-binding Zn ribbon-like protein